ncbi:MAG: histidine kinase dimerization/phosphoacceptor domain -containing protein [Anaerolineaceae bacterium]|nr:histidine kinase dimerization/phosphoacceptor domain -containing protein [Anaerolineaceae bacterium]
MNLWFIVPVLLAIAIWLGLWTVLRLIFWARAPQNIAGAAALIAEVVILLGFLGQLLTTDYQTIQVWNYLSLIGLWLIIPSWLSFVMIFTGYPEGIVQWFIKWVNKYTVCLYFLVSVILYIIHLTPSIGSWITAPQGMVVFGPFDLLEQKLGWIAIILVYLGVIETLVTIILLGRLLKKVNSFYRIQLGILIVAVLAVCLSLIMQGLNWNPIAPFSPIMLAFIPSCMLESWMFFSLRVGQQQPIIREKIVEYMSGSVIVLDAHERITYLNPSAVRMLNVEPLQALKRTLADIAPELTSELNIRKTHPVELKLGQETVSFENMVYNISRSVIQDWKGETSGRVLVLHNITDRERLEQTLQARAAELARSSAFTQALSQVAARLAASPDLDQVFQTMKVELRRMEIDFLVALSKPEQAGFVIEFLSLASPLLRQLERVTGISAKGFILPGYDELLRVGGAAKDRAIYYSQPVQSMRRIVSQLSGLFEQPIMNAIGLSTDTTGYVFPLATQNEEMGIFAVWGSALCLDDFSALASFAAQVSAAVQKARLLDSERRRVEELERSNRIVTSLAQVAARFEANLKLDEIMEVLGTELKNIGALCYLAFTDPDTDELIGAYTSIAPTIRHLAEDITKITISDIRIPFKSWLALDPNKTGPARIVEDPLKFASSAIRGVPKPILKKAVALAGIKTETPAVWLPLQASGKPIGMLVIWGVASPQQHLAAFTLFARQVATAIEKARLFADLEALKSFNEGIVQGVAEAIVMINLDGRITFANPATTKLIGVPVEELVGQKWAAFLPEEYHAKVRQMFENLTDRNETGFELNLLHRNGKTIPVMLSIQPRLANGRIESVLVSLMNIEQRVIAEQQLRVSNQEKEALLKEIHHRVKNNLQIISSLINLQSNLLKDAKVKEIFRESQNRVRSMALIHEKLYRSDNLANISFDEYIHDLGTSLVQAYKNDDNPVQLVIQACPITLDMDTAVPCSLIVNELITNSLKHAFANPDRQHAGGSAWIKISLVSRPDGSVRLCIQDNGPGFPADFDFFHTNSLGLQLVNSLVRQIEGSLVFSNQPGACVEIEFKV